MTTEAGLITHQQLARIASKAVPHIATAIVDHADDVLPRYGIVTPLHVQHFMAQVFVESGYLRRIDEDLSYTVARLRAVWPHRFPTDAAAKPYEHRPEALAALVYGGRMGNKTAEDAFANRGQGLLQTTGHDNLAALAKRLGVTIDEVRAMLTADAWMLECAAATFVMLGCLPLAARDDVEAVSRAINGGSTGLADRKAALKLCRRVWTASAVISPAALIPKPTRPTVASPEPIAMPTSTNPQSDAIAALERIAVDPRTIALVQKGLAGAERGVAALPDTGPLSGYKTYIVAALGVLSTITTVAVAMHNGGGLTWTGYLAAITALVTSSGFATIRAAIAGNHNATADALLSVGQSVVIQVAEAQAQHMVTAPIGAAVDAIQVAANDAAAAIQGALAGIQPAPSAPHA